MSDAVKKSRPQFRNIHVFENLPKYVLPPAGIVSILHRISGFALFLMLPMLMYLFDLSLASETSFEYMRGFVGSPLVKVILAGLSWAYLHHFCAGIRHLFMDLHMGVDKESGRKSAIGVFAVSIPLALLVALKLFGVF